MHACPVHAHTILLFLRPCPSRLKGFREATERQTCVEQCMLLMFRLRREVDALAQATGRAMSAFAVIPEAQVEVVPLRVDTFVAAHLVKLQDPTIVESAQALAAADKDTLALWERIVTDRCRDSLRRTGSTFAGSIQTDGCKAAVLFQKVMQTALPPRRKPTKRQKTADAKRARQPGRPPPPRASIRLGQPGRYTEEAHLDVTRGMPNIVAIDPGIKRVITAVNLGNPGGPSVVVSQAAYKDGTGRNWWVKRTGPGSTFYDERLAPVREHMSAVCARSVAGYSRYVAALGCCWEQWWAAKSPQRRRKDKFYVFSRRASFMAKVCVGGAPLCGGGGGLRPK